MRISELINEKFIVPELKAKTKKGVLKELVNNLASSENKVNPEELLRVLLEREKLGSTGIGEGIAIPHGKLKNIDKLILSFGKSIEGVDFESMDGKPVHLFFLLVAPENSAGTHLKALARISRLLKDPKFRQRLMDASAPEDIYKTIVQEDEKY